MQFIFYILYHLDTQTGDKDNGTNMMIIYILVAVVVVVVIIAVVGMVCFSKRARNHNEAPATVNVPRVPYDPAVIDPSRSNQPHQYEDPYTMVPPRPIQQISVEPYSTMNKTVNFDNPAYMS